MIIYRPHKGSLEESMQQAKEFETLDSMKEYLEKDWQGYFSADDIVIEERCQDDERNGWKDTRKVMSKRFGDQDNIAVHGCPQTIGYCAQQYLS